jgi:hypothetical protein
MCESGTALPDGCIGQGREGAYRSGIIRSNL